MAGRLILMKNSEKQIKGDCEAEKYEGWLKLETVSFGATSRVNHDSGTGSVHQSSIMCSMKFGPWVAELQQRLFQGGTLGEVELHEVEQKLDDNQKKTWELVRSYKLIDGWVESVQHSWNGIESSFQMQLQYEDVTFDWKGKVAHYNRSEKS